METLATLLALEAEAARFVRALAPRPAGATLVTLSGPLGAGKTAFTKAAAKALGIEETVTSPTFVLEKVYQLPVGRRFARFVHIDAYRLESGADLAPLGFGELVRDAGTLVFLEWPEKVAAALPPSATRITLAVEDGGARTLTYG